MYTVFVPVDESVERALGQARYVAGLPDAQNSVEAIVLYVFGEGSAEIPAEWQKWKSANRIESVKEARDVLRDNGVDVTVLDDSGEAAEDIVEYAADHDVDEVVLGGRKRSPARKAIFGSVTQDVILGTDLPVVVTGASSGS